MKKSFLAAAAILSLALASNASAQSVGEKTGVNSVLGVAPTTVDFVKEAALSDMTEIAPASWLRSAETPMRRRSRDR